jgi:TolB-like protein/Flp pilus assembly protein TadD
MSGPKIYLTCVLYAIALVLVSCASQVPLRGTPDEYREEVARLKQEVRQNPADSVARRDLGAIYVRTGRPAKGYEQLQDAFRRELEDPKTLFYLGVAREKTGRTDAAFRLYERYEEVLSDSPYRSLLQGRYEGLLRERARQKVAQKLEREERLTRRGVSSSTVAVLPFAYQGENERFAPLSRGLSEMISTDLAVIDRLTVVERLRLQALLDELELSRSDVVDSSTAPRSGLLLGAGRLVGGEFAIKQEAANVDVALAQLRQDTTSVDVESRSGALNRIFELEREIVFSVLRRLGIEREDLTAEEIAEIERAPTQNLQAFLAFCRGLREEDAGNFGAATEAYQQAQTQDPSFQEAQAREQQASALDAAGGSTDDALSSAAEVDPPPSTIDLVGQQLQGLSETVGTGFQRDPASEDQISSDLRDPPTPPPEGGSQ